MAFYLVCAVPKHGLKEELSARLAQDEFIAVKPFGRTLTHSLRNARMRRDGLAVREEEDYARHRSPKSARPYSMPISAIFASRR